MIGLTFTNARPSICPTNGVSPILGTNPICFGAPATWSIHFYMTPPPPFPARQGGAVCPEEKTTPEGWAIDLQGKPYTDTKGLLVDLIRQKASMLPIGGTDELSGSHKGYGLSTMVEILCAALQNGSYLNGLLGQDEKGKPALIS
jgi:LDH2 family malate/lactate/ureidoglycolate dehydrogenase